MMNVKWVLSGCLYIFLTGLFCSVGTGCRSTKKISTAISKKDTTAKNTVAVIDSSKLVDLHADSLKYINMLYDHLQNSRIDFNTFSAKLRVHYEGSDGKDNELTAFIRIQKDKAIWISINATLLGIEVFRVLITPDSVKVLNKLDKIYQLRSVSYLQEISHLPFDFNVLQSVILGNPVYLDSNILYYKKDEQGISILCDGDVFRNYLTLNKDDLTIKHSKLDDADQLYARSCDLTYGEYEKNGSILFSAYRKISVAEKAKLDIEMNFKQYSFNDNLNFPFSIPKNYKRK
jgi:Domain of unknown function (DUF4292)